MYLSSRDSLILYSNNQFDDFIVELPEMYRFREGEKWSVALTDISISSESMTSLPESIIVMSDIISDSLIQERYLPVLRPIPAHSKELITSLFHPHYILLTNLRISRIRIYCLSEKLTPLINSSLWDRDAITRCTLHFKNTA